MPTAPLATCAHPGCPNRVRRGYCAVHRATSSRNHFGVPRQRRGYDAAHDRARLAMRGRPCELRYSGCTGLATVRDHVVPVSRGGAGGLGRPSCAHCSNVQGARLANEARG